MFYGWWIIALVFLSSTFFSATIVSGFTAFFSPLIEEFNWSYAAISLAASIRVFELGLMDFVVGFILDKFGSRKVVFTGCVLIGLGFIMLGNINSLVMFYLVIAVICIGESGLSPVFVTYTMSQWFQKRLGLALGIAMAGYGAGGFVLPATVYLLDSVGWRDTFILFGVTAFVLGIILVVFLRNSPQDIGTTPDGSPEDEIMGISDNSRMSDTKSDAPQRDYSLKEVLAQRSFWILIYLSATGTFSVTMVLTHVMPYLEDLGYIRSLAGIVAMMIPVMSIAGRLGAGWVSDFIGSKSVLIVGVICQIIGIFLFLNAQLAYLLIPFVILFGIAWGGNVVIRLKILRNHYGKGQIGSITGAFVSFSMIVSFFGPWLAGLVFDTVGSYNIAWIVNIALLIVGIPMLLVLKNPQASEASNNLVLS